MGCHPSHWLSYFSRWLKPPTRSPCLFVKLVKSTMVLKASFPRRLKVLAVAGRMSGVGTRTQDGCLEMGDTLYTYYIYIYMYYICPYMHACIHTYYIFIIIYIYIYLLNYVLYIYIYATPPPRPTFFVLGMSLAALSFFSSSHLLQHCIRKVACAHAPGHISPTYVAVA